VFRNIVLLGIFSVLLVLPLASNSEATLWDLQITAHVDNTPLISGDRPIVSGIIVDHASKPVHKATVNIRSGSMSIFTTTSQSGEFMAELGTQARIPGNYIVNISATSSDGKTGITSIQFQVRGELSPTTVNQEKLSTSEAKKYLESSPEDFDRNPIGLILYNYYQKLYQEYLEDVKLSEKLAQEKAFIEEQKEIENKFRLKAIEEFSPGMGIFSGPQYENYVNNLDEAVRDTVIKNLNFTKNLVESAQELRNEILENGGTAEEAQLAYLEKIATTRDMLENFDSLENFEEINSGESSESVEDNSTNLDIIEEAVNEETSAKSPIKVDANGVIVEVEFNESVFFVNVNGKVLQFLVNGTEITLVNNE
jgi:hypothetical protein